MLNRIYLDDRSIDAEMSSDTSDYQPNLLRRNKTVNLKQLGLYFSTYVSELKKDFTKCMTAIVNEFHQHYEIFLDDQVYSPVKEEQRMIQMLKILKPEIENFQDKYILMKHNFPFFSKKKKIHIQDHRKSKFVDVIDKIVISSTHCKHPSSSSTGTLQNISKIILDEQLAKAQSLFDQQRFEEVIIQIKQIGKKKSFPELNFMMGNCLKAMNLPKQAIGQYNKAISESQKSCYFNNRGNCYLSMNMLKQAYQDYKKSIEIQPENDVYLGNCGNVCINLKIFSEAIKYYDKAIKLEPSKDSFYNNRAFAKIRLQKYDSAIEDYDKAIEINPSEQVYFKNRANLYIDKKKYNTAITDLLHAIEIDSRKHEFYYMLGKCQYLTNQFPKALVSIRKAVELQPEKPSYREFYNALKLELGYK